MQKQGDPSSLAGADQASFKKSQASGNASEDSDNFGLDYFREARFFLTGNRATLTFYDNSEVASIHYDTDRDEIFYKGHNVKNMTLNETQWMALQKFSEYLGKSSGAERLYYAYYGCLERLLRKKIK